MDEPEPAMTDIIEISEEEWNVSLQQAHTRVISLAHANITGNVPDRILKHYELVMFRKFVEQPEERPEFREIKAKLNEDHRKLTDRIRKYAKEHCPSDEDVFYNSLVSGIKLLKGYEDQPGYDIVSERVTGEKEEEKAEEKEEEEKAEEKEEE